LDAHVFTIIVEKLMSHSILEEKGKRKGLVDTTRSGL
jgi:hypothetical protein